MGEEEFKSLLYIPSKILKRIQIGHETIMIDAKKPIMYIPNCNIRSKYNIKMDNITEMTRMWNRLSIMILLLKRREKNGSSIASAGVWSKERVG